MHGSMGGGRKPGLSRLCRATRAPLAYPTALATSPFTRRQGLGIAFGHCCLAMPPPRARLLLAEAERRSASTSGRAGGRDYFRDAGAVHTGVERAVRALEVARCTTLADDWRASPLRAKRKRQDYDRQH